MLLRPISSIVDGMEATAMTKRIVSGVFLLIALGALGLILAGALTSGEQLIVRFLTAIIVAALCLYVISDLRLQADDSSASRASARKVPDGARRRPTAPAALPPNSTAAFMATVTGKRSASTASHDLAGLAEQDEKSVSPGPTGDAETHAESEFPPRPDHRGESDHDAEALAESEERAPAYTDETVDAEAWPALPDDPADLDEEPHSDGLVAIFSKQNQNEELEHDFEIEHHALVVNDHYRPPTSPYASSPKLTSIDGGALTVSPVQTPTFSTNDDDSATDDLGDEKLDGDDEEATLLTELLVLGDPHANPEPIVEEVEAAEVAATSEPLIEETPAGPPSTPDEMPPLTAMPGLEAAARARSRVIELLSHEDGVGDIDSAITSGELSIITSLVEDGSLSLEGPITDRDVRTMVFVAFTSSELRKILFAGGSLDTDDFDRGDLDLGPVEVFKAAEANPGGLADRAELERAASPELTEPSAPDSTSLASTSLASTSLDSTEFDDATDVDDVDVETEAEVGVSEQQPLVAG